MSLGRPSGGWGPVLKWFWAIALALLVIPVFSVLVQQEIVRACLVVHTQLQLCLEWWLFPYFNDRCKIDQMLFMLVWPTLFGREPFAQQIFSRSIETEYLSLSSICKASGWIETRNPLNRFLMTDFDARLLLFYHSNNRYLITWCLQLFLQTLLIGW